MYPLSPAEYAKFMGKRAEELRDRTQRALRKAADQGARLAKQRTLDIDKVDTGRFANSWRSGDYRDDGAIVWSSAWHAPWADDGQKPGEMPPLLALARWAERRLGVGGAQAWAAARAIAQKILERGTKGAEVVKWVAKRLGPIAQRELQKEFDKP